MHQRSPPLPDPEPSDAARASEGFGLRSPDVGPEMTDQRDAKTLPAGLTRTSMKNSPMAAQCMDGVITKQSRRYGSLKIW